MCSITIVFVQDYQVQTEQNIKKLEEVCEKERNTWADSVAQLEELYQVEIIWKMLKLLNQ